MFTKVSCSIHIGITIDFPLILNNQHSTCPLPNHTTVILSLLSSGKTFFFFESSLPTFLFCFTRKSTSTYTYPRIYITHVYTDSLSNFDYKTLSHRLQIHRQKLGLSSAGTLRNVSFPPPSLPAPHQEWLVNYAEVKNVSSFAGWFRQGICTHKSGFSSVRRPHALPPPDHAHPFGRVFLAPFF